MSPRKSLEENSVETVELRGLAPHKPKNFNHMEKGAKINIKDAISRLSSDTKILIELAEGRPKPSKELEAAIGRSEDTVRTQTGRLVEAGMIKKTPEGWVISYSKFLTSEVNKAFMRANTRIKVNEALKELRAERYEGVTLQDVSRKTRLSPRVIEEDAYLLAPDHGLAVADESSWRVELSADEHPLDIMTAHSIREKLSRVDPKSRVK